MTIPPNFFKKDILDRLAQNTIHGAHSRTGGSDEYVDNVHPNPPPTPAHHPRSQISQLQKLHKPQASKETTTVKVQTPLARLKHCCDTSWSLPELVPSRANLHTQGNKTRRCWTTRVRCEREEEE